MTPEVKARGHGRMTDGIRTQRACETDGSTQPRVEQSEPGDQGTDWNLSPL